MRPKGICTDAKITAANLHDGKMLKEMIDAIPPVYSGRAGRPRFRPDKLHADKGYDFRVCGDVLIERGIKRRIARRGIESSERLGKHRWVAECTQAWVNSLIRLKVRYEQRADIYKAFLTVACALICFRSL